MTIDHERLQQAAGFVDQWLDVQQKVQNVPGAAVAIRSGDELVLARGYGFANLERQEPMTARHIFRIASHSKTFTATAVMQLVEEGAVRLDEPVGSYLCDLPDDVAAVTVRQLLNHASGVVRDGHDSDYWQLDRRFPNEVELRALAEGIQPANESFKYSNIGYGLLGLIVEAASGLPYHEYVQRFIVDALGLRDTGPETTPEIGDRLVTGYTGTQLPLPRTAIPDVPTGAMAAATGFYSNAEELSRYAAAHFLGTGELLGDRSKREMQQPYWPEDTSESPKGHYGLGFAVKTIGKRRMAGHGGSFPGHSTRTWLDAKDRLAVVVLTNESGGPAAILAEGIVKIIDFALAAPATGSAVALDRFTGRFANLWGVTDIVRFGDALYALNPALENPVDDPVELEVVDEDTLRITKTSGYGSPGEPVRYFRAADGRIERIVFGGGSSYPLEVARARLAALRAPEPAGIGEVQE